MELQQRVIIERFGGPEVLRLVQAPLPVPTAQQARVRVLAAGIGYADVMAQRGGYPLAPSRPFTPGYDLAGIVEEVGSSVTGLAVGQYVAGLNPGMGCYAQQICVDAGYLVPVPAGLEPAAVVSLVLNYLTAHSILHRHARVRAGQSVLIHAAAGGVGTALLQLGRLAQLTLYGTASANKHALVRSLGGVPIDYRQTDFVQAVLRATGSGVDAAFDPIGGAHLRRSFDAVKRGGCVVCYGFAGSHFGGWWPMIAGVAQMNWLNLLPHGRRVSLCAKPGEVKRDPAEYRATLTQLLELLRSGQIQPIIGRRFPLAEVSAAHQALEQGANSGKLVLLPCSA